MDSPIVTVGQQLKNDIAARFEPVKVEVPQPNTGFASLDNPEPAPAAAPPAPAAPAAPPAKPVPDVEQRMAKVLSQAQKTQAERQAFLAEQAKFKADLDRLAKYDELKARAKEDPVSWAELADYKADEYAAVLMDKGSLSPERRKILEQQRELNDMKAWRQQVEQEKVQQHTQTMYQHVRGEMERFAQAAGEQYDLVSRTKSYDKVLERIQKHYQETAALGDPEILPYEDAFSAVELELENTYLPVIESPKLRSRLTGTPAEASSPTAPSSQSAARKPIGTINSKMRAATTQPKGLSESERFAAAGDVFLQQIFGGQRK